MTGQTCGTCRFFISAREGEGQCRRLPPMPIPELKCGQPQFGAFPLVKAEAWCGEWAGVDT